jgi:hypothetical protein
MCLPSSPPHAFPASAGGGEAGPGRRVAWATAACSAGQDRLPFGFAESAPYPVGLPRCQGVLRTRPDDRAACADGFGCGFSSRAGRATFPLGVEEKFRTLAAARPMELPLPFLRTGAWKSSDVGHQP